MTNVYTNKIDGTEHEFNCYPDIPMSRKIAFVANVTKFLTSGGMYNGIAKKMFFDFEIINAFTDINTDIEGQEDAIGFIEDMVYNTDIVEKVKTNIASSVLMGLETAVNENIEYLTGIHINPIENAIANLISSDWMTGMILKILTNANEKLNRLDMDALSGFMNKIKDMPLDFTPDKVIEAYMNTDMFKASQAERNEILATREEKAVMTNDNHGDQK